MDRGRGRLFVLLAAGILLPGVILALLGFRSLRQDRVLAERQARDALQSAVELAGREVARELARWPEWNVPGAATLTLAPSGRLQAARGLLWWPGTLAEPVLPREAQLAEEFEIRQKDYAKAIALYEAALHDAPAEARATLLLKIARTARKAGDVEKARRSWQLILSLPECPATAAARTPRLRTDTPAGLPPTRGDRAALASALGNLLDNAVKYSPPESPVKLAANAANGKLSISVTDQGPGIAPEEQARIFDWFYRGGGELSKQVKGAGIGLSLVKRIVEDHGGKVAVVSAPGEGSTFTIDLEVIREQPA